VQLVVNYKLLSCLESLRSRNKPSMKFTLGDSIDSNLTTSIAHEYLRCKDCFDLFVENEQLRFRNNSKELKIRSYNLYSDFLIHLYEFYVGCFKRDRRSTADIQHADLDKIFVFETQKLMNMAADRIRRGAAPSWENDLSVYTVTVADQFGKHFRWIRNRNSHVDYRRASGDEISLGDFFEKYHFYAHMLYQYPAWLWHVKDIDKYDFKEIENFNISVSSHRDS
jgi:hypothetical protein